MTNPGWRAQPSGFHKHQCHFCAFVWEHSDACDKSHNAVVGAHECPSCGHCNWGLGIYEGPEEPRTRNGLGPLPIGKPVTS